MRIGICDVLEAFDIKSARIVFVFNDDRKFFDDEIFCSRALLMKILVFQPDPNSGNYALPSALNFMLTSHYTLLSCTIQQHSAALSSTILPDQIDLKRNLFKELVLFFNFFRINHAKKSKNKTNSLNKFRLRSI